MKKTLLGLAVTALLMVSSAAHAITYTINRTIGTGSVTGFIETDGTLGILGSGHIEDWVLTLTLPSHPSTPIIEMEKADRGITLIQGNALSATASELMFDFSLTNTVFGVAGRLNNWCVGFGTSFCGENAPTESLGFFQDGGALYETADRQGHVVLGTVSTIPLPLGLPLFAGGLALITFFSKFRIRRTPALA